MIEILPDLVFHMPYPSGPLPGAPKTGYCGKQGSTALASEVVVGVRNKGLKPVRNSFVSVTMRTSPTTTSTVNKPLGPLAAGAVGTVKFPLSKGAWKDGEAKFKMKIDTGNDIKEGAGENNNQREYTCVEPVT
ncbi:CARDB domain-containing protein [Denitrobaculum tricleocarpae]|uniref:CARDB domain-containing protein n=1 Tax=Denitrobaculum tricleocarpae TaxID=2591009 RepID=UPI0015D11B19|nr:CARDB domain-containing protein [Denitrobaculum tricleocarpae]